ncbi:MAG: hypothetical protein M1823_005320 [Watsoniomyces obsoletus]|nr:MAG: hypothetical protein M1823_005320 [Watsoniomyces obsoletus]
MESAPLTRGHAHSRSAASAARSSNSTAAVNEHLFAASEFAQAATGTADAEALRTLRLLEGHHQKLHEILQFRSSHPVSDKARDALSEVDAKSDAAATTAIPASTSTAPKSPLPARSSSPPRSAHQPPTLAPTSRSSPRDLNSSIASNLASARGIPSGQRRRTTSPAVGNEQAGGRILASLDKKRASEASKLRESTSHQDRSSSVVQEASEGSRRSSGQSSAPKREGDVDRRHSSVPATSASAQETSTEPFQRFYSTFENLISKLSAPLAFAGLPLAGDAPGPVVSEKPPQTTGTADQERVTAAPDLSRIFSKAALQAVKESNGPNILGAGAESFYVVPTTGGTISYAGILSKAEQERRARADGGTTRDGLTEGADDDDESEFVDAREMPPTPSPEKSRHGQSQAWRFGPQSAGPPTVGSTKTLEELQLENQALKQLSDTLSRRLHMWEVNAQSSSMALQQSLRALQRSPVTSDAGRPAVGGGGGGDETSDHTKELEEQLRAATRDLEMLKKENTKLRGVVTRYREKWDKLKEGASRRRAEKKE